MDRMTDEHAAQLIDRIGVLADQLEAANKSQRRLKIITAVVAAVVVVVAFLMFEQRSDGKDLREQADRLDSTIADIQVSRVQQCENGNATRAGQRAIWSFYFEVITAANPDAPEAVLDFYDAYLAWITDEVLPDRDCTDLGKKYPEIGPPPSFKEALEESQRQEAAE